MKKLIYTFTFFVVSLGVFAQTAPVQEIVNPDDGKQIVSVVKDMQVLEMLEKTSEFKNCREMNKFDATASDKARNDAIQKAQNCFRTELEEPKSKEKLTTLSEALNLQHYGLVQSKNLKDIQNYLADKMYESLTGVNPKDADFKEKMKFKNKKHIDQKTFIEMYRSQLGKNALYEVSRFCFQDLRSKVSAASNAESFSEHWKNYQKGNLTIKNVDDFGKPVFGSNLSAPDDKSAVYKEIFASIQTADSTKAMDSQTMSDFFLECGKLIVPLCAEYQTSTAKKSLDNITSQVKLSGNASIGAAACLAKGRIQDYRKALADVEKVDEEFVKMASSNADFGNLALKGQPIKLFESGKNGNETIDDLTNFTSSDVLEGGYTKDELAKKKAEDCAKRAELAECEGFITEGEDLDKAKHNVEMELTLKREVEMARVKKLAESEQSLEEYLKENGFFELLKGDQYKTMNEQQLMDAIGTSYEAKKLATLQQINNKLGARQVAKGVTPNVVQANALEVTKQATEERSRLAQVVLFNNIITSHLSLKKKDANGKEQSAGRNINVWKREEAALGASKVDPGLFQNLKAGSDGETGLGKDNQIAGFELLDEILGKEK